MGKYLVIKHQWSPEMLLRKWEEGVYDYFHGMWSSYSTIPIEFSKTTLILHEFEAENDEEAVIIYKLLLS